MRKSGLGHIQELKQQNYNGQGMHNKLLWFSKWCLNLLNCQAVSLDQSYSSACI